MNPAAAPVDDGQGSQLSISQCVTMACLLEVSACKPGNVHRSADFNDMQFTDFLISAAVIGRVLEPSPEQTVGRSILEAVAATRSWVGKNTNLGTILLLAPLAAVPPHQSIRSAIKVVLNSLTTDDAKSVYQAIRLANPGGLGRSSTMDVNDVPPACLLDAMRRAADRDLVAKQFVTDFAFVLDGVVPWIQQGQKQGWPLSTTLVHTHLQIMADQPDSLIERKCGREIADDSARRAQQVLSAGSPASDLYQNRLASFDSWLRSDQHRRNPGTTADLIAAGLFVMLREQGLDPPFRFGDQ